MKRYFFYKNSFKCQDYTIQIGKTLILETIFLLSIKYEVLGIKYKAHNLA